MLIAPSWGGMGNGLLTLRGAWDRVRENPVLKFFVVAVTCYGMATFEGPMLSLKNVNAISHFTDWTVAHVHIGGLGWNGFMVFGMLYWLIPRMYGVELYSKKLANAHFWIGTLGIVMYAVPMYWAGFAQSLMWKEFTEEGTLRYPNFLETVTQIIPMYLFRAIGGTLFLCGAIVMVYNLLKTIALGKLTADEEAMAPALSSDYKVEGEHWHRVLERRPVQLLIGATIVILIGGIIELVPTFMIKSNVPTIAEVKPYTPLELEGRDIYIREGCVSCHSQLVRPFRSEVVRYKGEYSKSGEFVYDHPFLWGSKRTGPDLLRIGGKYPHSWHYQHMIEPGSISPGSIMPAYPWLADNKLNTSYTASKIKAMQSLGVPYKKGYENMAVADLVKQAKQLSNELKADKIEADPETEIIAMIAYLQRLGSDIKITK